ncbi:hypothetical protein SAY86_026778 [Trapa natans]|uniref:Uncharacterized protein n=1 Tax=Trapa natans TaxID=22666 RepID=A0AAN7KBC9_TRANT|nr:hypothetical protein SAY86_026778 [Trapa natans]
MLNRHLSTDSSTAENPIWGVWPSFGSTSTAARRATSELHTVLYEPVHLTNRLPTLLLVAFQPHLGRFLSHPGHQVSDKGHHTYGCCHSLPSEQDNCTLINCLYLAGYYIHIS